MRKSGGLGGDMQDGNEDGVFDEHFASRPNVGMDHWRIEGTFVYKNDEEFVDLRHVIEVQKAHHSWPRKVQRGLRLQMEGHSLDVLCIYAHSASAEAQENYNLFERQVLLTIAEIDEETTVSLRERRVGLDTLAATVLTGVLCAAAATRTGTWGELALAIALGLGFLFALFSLVYEVLPFTGRATRSANEVATDIIEGNRSALPRWERG